MTIQEHILNLKSKKLHLDINDYEEEHQEVHEVFICNGQSYEFTAYINKVSYKLTGSDEMDDYEIKFKVHSPTLKALDDNDDLIDLDLSDDEIINIVFCSID